MAEPSGRCQVLYVQDDFARRGLASRRVDLTIYLKVSPSEFALKESPSFFVDFCYYELNHGSKGKIKHPEEIVHPGWVGVYS